MESYLAVIVIVTFALMVITLMGHSHFLLVGFAAAAVFFMGVTVTPFLLGLEVEPSSSEPFNWAPVLAILSWIWWIAKYLLSGLAVYATWWGAKRFWVWFCNPIPFWLARWLDRPTARRSHWKPLSTHDLQLFAWVNQHASESQKILWRWDHSEAALKCADAIVTRPLTEKILYLDDPRRKVS